tara:strand:- start:4317 stop:4499 length:183 start_codon:yes stop_codon:yes gene_type:complete
MLNIKQIIEIIILLCILYSNNYILIDIFNIYIERININDIKYLIDDNNIELKKEINNTYV